MTAGSGKFDKIKNIGQIYTCSYLDNKRAIESVNLEQFSESNICVEDLHQVGPFKVWNTADRWGRNQTHRRH